MRLFQVVTLLVLSVSVQEIYAKRVALLIGNANYQYENKLANPINDTNLLEKVLKNDLKFDEVQVLKNADSRTLNRTVAEFNQKAQGADVAVVYFSGHGQQSNDRQNYLLATDAKIEHSIDLRRDAVTSDDLVNATEGAKSRIIILDACRDRPSSGFKSATKGLARTSINGQGLLIAYATESGKVAQDGVSGGNSPYASALAKAMRQKDKPILKMFDDVAEEVGNTTKGQQAPTREGNLRVDVYFINPTININQNTTPVQQDAELIFWDSIKNETDAESYQAYLQQYPNGKFKVLAETRIKKYTVKPSQTVVQQPASVVQQPTVLNSDDDNTTLMQKGLWRDPQTNLVWMRCSLGQTWNGTTCIGKASKYKWEAAFKAIEDMNRTSFGGYTDWRLPDIEELSSIRYCSTGFRETVDIPTRTDKTKTIDFYCKDGSQKPTINTQIFPNTLDNFYWSGSPSAYVNYAAWSVYFHKGLSGSSHRNDKDHVRAVRSGQ